MAWTEAQQKVIDTRNKNLLVSAAAGSGKTAVLVERIISMISEGDSPLDIDHLIVVTFTNAAAAEMRERVGKAIDAKLNANPDNQHLQKQISLLQSAQITTIHSFCLNVIRNYFHRIDLDPSFKIAEESEITLMKSDVISDILERWYEEGREDFHEFIESYSYSKSDAPAEDLILQIYNFAMSDPWPKSWIASKKKMFEMGSLTELYQAPWMLELMNYLRSVLGDLYEINAKAMAVCNESGGPGAYLSALLSDCNILDQLQKASSYEESAVVFSEIAYERLSAKKDDSVQAWKKDKVKALREDVKKGLKDLTAQFFFQAPEEMLKDLQSVNQVMQVLFDLTMEFMEEFANKKEEKNLIDFNDLEHFALKILVEEDGAVPTQAALELSELFEEILIDEYQDSNMVQETILRSISREDMGYPNRFMVGDVKQSIYKFRLAMPEIFMEKYGKYSLEDLDSKGQRNQFQRIDLDKNFRSRKQVLDYVNKIFEQIMQQSVGGIIYDAAAALKYGGLYDVKTTPKEENSNKVSTGQDNIVYEDINKVNLDQVNLDQVNLDQVNVDQVNVDQVNVDQVNVDQDNVDQVNINQENINRGNSNKQHDFECRLAHEVDFLIVTDEDLSQDENTDTSTVTEKGNVTGNLDYISTGNEEEEAAYTKKEIEARVIVKKIRELTDPSKGMLVTDKATKELRPATYRDIVILLRSMSNWSEVFVNTLMQEGIPAYADTGTGYFQTLEIMTVLNMLRIIDNPRQDIPLTGVLYSPMVGLTSTQLAMVRASHRGVSMYTALLNYRLEGTDEELRAILEKFILRLENLRSVVNYKPIHEIIQLVLDQTGYYYYVSAMPGGDRRKANIDMLVSQAVRFEKGSYTGLFHFIRYIEKLHKYEVDFGEASTSGEQDDTIRIMSIHKSKGLEFPIVFVAGMSKQFNTQDLRSAIVLHSELGVGPEYIDSKLRTKVPTLLKKVIQKKVQIENLGEELRVLYVAMTRAKEKLILTGYIKSVKEIVKKDFSFFELLSAKSYFEWVLPAMQNRMDKMPAIDTLPAVWKSEGMTISIISQRDLLKQEVTKQLFQRKDKEELLCINLDETYDSDLKQEIKCRFNYLYPYANDAKLKIKMTVSELKKLGQQVDEEESVQLYLLSETDTLDNVIVDMQGNLHLNNNENNQENIAQKNTSQVEVTQDIITPEKIDLQNINQEKITQVKNVNEKLTHDSLPLEESTVLVQKVKTESYIPNFVQEKETAITGTDRGTLYHKVLELVDLTKVGSIKDLSLEIERMVANNLVNNDDVKKLKLDYIYRFVISDVAERMRQAQILNKLYKEKQFVMGIKAKEVIKDSDSEELILIQGIIDVFFEEMEELVLLDYKSDLVEDEQQLINRYRVQLHYYRRALEQMLGKQVNEMIIYSLPLGKEIRIDD